MSHPSPVILRDSRGRIVRCTIATDDHDGRFHFACWFCDGDFLSFHSCEAHIRNCHSMATSIKPQPVIKIETTMEVNEIVEILSDDDELETISVSSDEDGQPSNTSANAQHQVIVTPANVQNGINGSANTKNGETVIKQSERKETQPSKESPTNGTLTNGTLQPSDENPETQHQQPNQPKPSTSTDAKSDESDDDVSSISSIETVKSTGSNRRENRQRPNANPSDMAANYPCKFCPETFATFSDYWTHEYSCDECRKNKFPCPVEGCAKKYACRKSRDDHVDKKHKYFGFRCGICSRRFPMEKQKREHQIKMHSNNEIKPCYFCESKCYSEYQRNLHVKKYHTNGTYILHPRAALVLGTRF